MARLVTLRCGREWAFAFARVCPYTACAPSHDENPLLFVGQGWELFWKPSPERREKIGCHGLT